MKTSLLIRRVQDFLSTRPWAAVLAVILFAGPLQGGEPRSGRIDWDPWSFDWEVKDGAGLGIRNVHYNHKLVIFKANMPVIRVKYDRGEPPCGHLDGTATPFVERINWEDLRTSVSFCSGSVRDGLDTEKKVYQLRYGDSADGRQWLQIGAFAYLKFGDQTLPTNPDSSRLHMGWRFSKDGEIKPFLQSAVVIACDHAHTRYAYWRIDFDVWDSAGDQVWVYDKGGPDEGGGLGRGWHKYTTELNAVKNDSTDRYWYVRDAVTGDGVLIYPGPTPIRSTLDVGPRRYRFPLEGVPWPGADSKDEVMGDLPYADPPENIAEKDIAIWCVSQVRHRGDGGCKWISNNGPTFKVNYHVSR